MSRPRAGIAPGRLLAVCCPEAGGSLLTVTARRTLDRSGLEALMAREIRQFRDDHPRSLALFERAKGSLLAGVPMNWMVKWAGGFPIFVERAAGRISATSTATSTSTSAWAIPGRWPATAPRPPSPPSSASSTAAGSPTCCRPRTRSGAARSSSAGSASSTGSSRSPPPMRTASRSGWPGWSPAGRRSPSTTSAITARSTRRSRPSLRTAVSRLARATWDRRSIRP